MEAEPIVTVLLLIENPEERARVEKELGIRLPGLEIRSQTSRIRVSDLRRKFETGREYDAIVYSPPHGQTHEKTARNLYELMIRRPNMRQLLYIRRWRRRFFMYRSDTETFIPLGDVQAMADALTKK